VEQIAGDLNEFVRTAFDIPADDEDFGNDVHLFDYGYVDSFGAVAIIDFVRDRFGVQITDQDLMVRPLNTVHESAGLVAERLGGGDAPH